VVPRGPLFVRPASRRAPSAARHTSRANGWQHHPCTGADQGPPCWHVSRRQFPGGNAHGVCSQPRDVARARSAVPPPPRTRPGPNGRRRVGPPPGPPDQARHAVHGPGVGRARRGSTSETGPRRPPASLLPGQGRGSAFHHVGLAPPPAGQDLEGLLDLRPRFWPMVRPSGSGHPGDSGPTVVRRVGAAQRGEHGVGQVLGPTPHSSP